MKTMLYIQQEKNDLKRDQIPEAKRKEPIKEILPKLERRTLRKYGYSVHVKEKMCYRALRKQTSESHTAFFTNETS